MLGWEDYGASGPFPNLSPWGGVGHRVCKAKGMLFDVSSLPLLPGSLCQPVPWQAVEVGLFSVSLYNPTLAPSWETGVTSVPVSHLRMTPAPEPSPHFEEALQEPRL